jgi:hypothetical protein
MRPCSNLLGLRMVPEFGVGVAPKPCVRAPPSPKGPSVSRLGGRPLNTHVHRGVSLKGEVA